MWISIVLCLIGFILIYLEFFLPGSLIGVIGGILILVGAIYFSLLEIPLGYKVLYSIGSLGIIFLTCKLAIWMMKRGQKDTFYLSANQEGFVASSFDKIFFGMKGETLCDLKPSGFILVEGNRFQALSEGEFIRKGTKIVILNGRGSHYIVKEIL